MKTKFSLTCDYANRDINGKVMMIGIFDSISAMSVPCLHPSFYFVVGLDTVSSENGNYPFSIKIYERETKTEVTQIQDSFELDRKDDGIHTLIIGFAGVIFPLVGTYTLDFMINGKIFASESIAVHELPSK